MLIAAVLILLVYGGISTGEERADPLPFDPLSESEQATAIEIALADPLVDILLTRYETIGAALNTDKDRMRADPASRMADVWFYEYTLDHTVWARVDLRAGVVAAKDTALYQPPITVGEMERAGAMALEDPRVQEALAARQPFDEVETMARLWTGTAPGACPLHRCALVAFNLDGEYQPDLFVRVNLSGGVADQLLAGAAQVAVPLGVEL